MQSLISFKTMASRNLSQKSQNIILDRDGFFSFFFFEENLTSSSVSSPAFSSVFSLSVGSTVGDVAVVPLYQITATIMSAVVNTLFINNNSYSSSQEEGSNVELPLPISTEAQS